MNKTHKQSRQTGQLEKKLAAYTFAGAAALVAPGVAKADIVYVPNVDTTVSQSSVPNNLTFPFANDITLTAQYARPTPSEDLLNEVSVSAGAGAAILLDAAPFQEDVSALAFGAVIDPTNPTNWGSGGKLVGYDPAFSSVQGDWSATGGTSYMGFYFGTPGSPQAGWAQIATTADATTSSFELLSYAYETTPDVKITAGQITETPEPSALPLLVLGGAGLIALRRRRAANA